MFIWNRLLLDKDGGDGGGNGPEASFQRLLDRNNNDGIGIARQLFGENHDYRKEIRELKEQVAQLTGKVPAEGTTVLSAADALLWQAYQALGKPDEIKQGLEKRTELQGKLTELERETLLRGVAESAGYKPVVLSQLDRMAAAQGKQLVFDMRDVTVDGKTTKAAFVKDGDKEVPLGEYAQSNWSDFLPALTQSSSGGGQQSGTRFVTQHAGSGSGKTDLVSTFLQEQDAARAAVKNPLLKG